MGLLPGGNHRRPDRFIRLRARDPTLGHRKRATRRDRLQPGHGTRQGLSRRDPPRQADPTRVLLRPTVGIRGRVVADDGELRRQPHLPGATRLRTDVLRGLRPGGLAALEHPDRQVVGNRRSRRRSRELPAVDAVHVVAGPRQVPERKDQPEPVARRSALQGRIRPASFTGNVDALTIGTDDGAGAITTTNYDFEPTTIPPPGMPDFNPVTPARVFDTRAGTPAGAPRRGQGPCGPTDPLVVQLTDLPGGLVPAQWCRRRVDQRDRDGFARPRFRHRRPVRVGCR